MSLLDKNYTRRTGGRRISYLTYVVSSGLRVHATASMTNGMEIMTVICKIMNSGPCATLGFVIINGNGRVMTNQITESITIISNCFFFFGFTRGSAVLMY